jgi:hypothetical protein
MYRSKKIKITIEDIIAIQFSQFYYALPKLYGNMVNQSKALIYLLPFFGTDTPSLDFSPAIRE